jgi:hypothetical protein
MTTSNPNIYVRQWDVGSFTDPGKKPYKISERYNGTWECSCPAWTRHTPRTDCKHIIKVKKASYFSPQNPVFVAAPPAANQPAITEQRVIIDGYAIRRRPLEDTLPNANTVVDATTATTRRNRRNI